MKEAILVERELTPEQWLRKNVDLDAGDMRKMTTKELRARFKSKPKKPPEPGLPWRLTVNDARLINTFIWQSYQMIKAGTLKPLKGNLRSFWYRELRPFLKHHILLESDEGPGGNELAALALRSSEMEEILETLGGEAGDEWSLFNALGAGGQEKGRELYLINRTGKSFDEFVLKGFFRFKGEFKLQDPREAFRIIGRKKPRIIFFTEKEGLFLLCEEFAREYGISAVASHGEPGYPYFGSLMFQQ